MLSDFGAEVLKIEQPRRGDPLRGLGQKKDGVDLWWKVYARNKKSVTIDLRQEEGQELVRRLVKDADVLIENFRPGTMEQWNLGWDELRAVNPELIMLRVTGYGRKGPYAKKPGFGTLCEAMSGFAHLNGFPDGPPTLPPMAVADGIAALYGAIGILVAKLAQVTNSHPGGQVVDVSILDAIFSILGYQLIEYDQLGVVMTRSGNRSGSSVPRNVYKTKDDQWVAVSSSTDSIAQRVLGMVGGGELLNDERFRDPAARRAHADELDEIVARWVRERNLDDVMRAFDENQAAAAPAYNIAQIVNDPHFTENEILVEADDDELGPIMMPAVVPRLSGSPGRISFPGQKLSSDTRSVLARYAGLDEESLDEFEARGII